MRKGWMSAFLLFAGDSDRCCFPAAPSPAQQKSLKAGEDAQGPWWMKETAMTRDGIFPVLKDKPWWPKAAALKTGESFIVEEGPGKGRELVRAERIHGPLREGA